MILVAHISEIRTHSHDKVLDITYNFVFQDSLINHFIIFNIYELHQILIFETP